MYYELGRAGIAQEVRRNLRTDWTILQVETTRIGVSDCQQDSKHSFVERSQDCSGLPAESNSSSTTGSYPWVGRKHPRPSLREGSRGSTRSGVWMTRSVEDTAPRSSSTARSRNVRGLETCTVPFALDMDATSAPSGGPGAGSNSPPEPIPL